MTSYKDRIKKARQQLETRHREEQERPDRPRFGSIFELSKIPNNLPFWKCGEGRHEIDVVPFFAGKDHPEVAEGDLTYSVPVYIHREVGPTDEVYVCPKFNFASPCPICEYIEKNKPLPKDEFTQIAVKQRTIYYIWSHDDQTQEKEGVQIWEVAKFFFADHIKEISKGSPGDPGGGIVWSSDTKDGKRIVWTRKGSGQTNTQYLGHRLVERAEALPDWVLEQVETAPLDGLIKMHPTYEEIYEAFFGTSASPAAKDVSPEEVLPSKNTGCPKGGEMGKSWKEFEYCEECPLWDDCSDVFDKLSKAIGSQPSPVPDPDPAHTTGTGRKGRRAR